MTQDSTASAIPQETLREWREACERATLEWLPNYEILESGRVICTNTNWRGMTCREMAQHPNRCGYMAVKVRIGDTCKRLTVHRLVCEAFHGKKPSEEHQVRHLNGNKLDNRACNLAWGTAADNARDRTAHGTCKAAENGRKSAQRFRGEAGSSAKLNRNQVREIRARGDGGATMKGLAREYQVSRRLIQMIVKRQAWTWLT